MSDERTWTRRNVLRTGGAIAGVSSLAGCLDSLGGSESEIEYTVSMPPVGEVGFPSVPETWAANNGSWADMGIALGQEPPEAVYLTSRYHTQYYDEIPDVSVDKSDMDALWGDGNLSPEEFMSLSEDVDLFVMDPNFIVGRADGWDQEDIDRVESTGTPFFGNSIFSRGYGWHDYEYLTLLEAFEKLSQVFQEEDRYEAFVDLHERFQSNVADIVPPEAERPDVAIMWATEELDSFSPYLIDESTSFKQWRDLEVTDAFANTDVRDFHSDRGAVDYETLLDIDPEVLLFRGLENKTAQEFQSDIVSKLEADDTAQKLTAVQNGDVYRGGPLYQGPITNLVVTQRAAEQLYDVDEQLYDPQEVGDIVNGNL
ncbi:ABC transporter substrate-binding protein [Haloarchaeobius amylolyticus]|uniref:ABC transporter substrate-binding protein n=1 Tax=Haloarchaeobius amylolyticus TaxID=1198296 RepID=A0ABD6BKM8_9EURY